VTTLYLAGASGPQGVEFSRIRSFLDDGFALASIFLLSLSLSLSLSLLVGLLTLNPEIAAQTTTPVVTTNNGTSGTIPVWTGAADIENTSPTLTGTVAGNLLSAGATVCAITPMTATTARLIGLVVANGGTSGNAVIAVSGVAGCLFDAATTVTAGDYAAASTASAGKCRDGGSGTSPAGEYFGVVIDGATSPNQTLRVALAIQHQ